jgi:hypothetical protein
MDRLQPRALVGSPEAGRTQRLPPNPLTLLVPQWPLVTRLVGLPHPPESIAFPDVVRGIQIAAVRVQKQAYQNIVIQY